jgi:hypothetical protein
MSNYIVKNYGGISGNDKNLTEIFQPIGSTTVFAAETGYKQGGSDLNTIFAKLVSGNPAAATSYIVKNYNGQSGNDLDLSSIFQFDPLIVTLWSALGVGTNGIVLASAVDINGNLYIGGEGITEVYYGSTTVSVKNLAMWNPTTSQWSDVGGGIQNVGSTVVPFVTAIMIDGSNIYIGGLFNTAGTTLTPVKNIAMWNGTQWSDVGGGVSGATIIVSVFTITSDGNGKIYVGGIFSTVGVSTAAYSIAIWTPSSGSWSTLGGSNGVEGTVCSIQISGSSVYVGGGFSFVGIYPSFLTAANNIAIWNTTTSQWSALSSGLTYSVAGDAIVKSIAISYAGIYVGGIFSSAGGIPVNSIALWNGVAWIDVGGGVSVSSSISPPYEVSVNTIKTNGTDIYVGGNFLNAGTSSLLVNCVAKWDGSVWTDLEKGCDDGFIGGQTVATISINNTSMYVGGAFESVGPDSALIVNCIAKYPVTVPVPLPQYSAFGGYSISSDSNYNTILTYFTSGSIIFYTFPTSDPVVIVTGGGAGGEAGNTYSFPGGRGGGGSISLQYSLSIPILNNLNAVTVGAGGAGGYYTSPFYFNPYPGSDSILNYNFTDYISSGGTIYTGGAGGVSNTQGSASVNINGGGGGGGGSNDSGNYSGGLGQISGTGGNGGFGGTDTGLGQNGLGTGNGGGGGGGGSNGSQYTQLFHASGGPGGNGNVILKFNMP